MKEVRIDLQDGTRGIGYRINQETKTYVSGSITDGTFTVESEIAEYADPQKLANQLYYLILASLSNGSEHNKKESG